MKLTVDNFAFIKHAEIDIDGITVIAGNNNTGKSTVGKILFSMFHAFYDIDEKIERARKNAISDALKVVVSEVHGPFQRVAYPWKGYLRNGVFRTQKLEDVNWADFYGSIIQDYPEFAKSANLLKLKNTVNKILHWPEKKLLQEAVLSAFTSVFNGQINSLYLPATIANADLMIKAKTISVAINNGNTCECSMPIQIKNRVFYYSSPHIVDLLSLTGDTNSVMERKLWEALYSYANDVTEEQKILERSMQKEKLQYIMQHLDSASQGRIAKEQGEYTINCAGMTAALKMKNLSAGLKAFVVIRMLVESGNLKDRDVLILDEPEIHLHPTWQLKYAELIVLLQKEFNLSVVITTHSNFFLDAIETYTRKYEVQDKLHLYLAEQKEDGVEMLDVTNNSEAIYSKMADAVDILDSERLAMD